MSRRKMMDDDERALTNLVRRYKRYEAALREIATRPRVEFNPDGDEQAAYTMALIAEEALKDEPVLDGKDLADGD